MTIVLCGENTFVVREQLKKIVREFKDVHGPHAIEALDATNLTIPQLRENINAATLFAPERLVIIKNATENKELFTELGTVAAELPEGVQLIIVEGVLDKRTKTYKTLKNLTDFREYGLLSDSDLQQWIVATAKEVKGDITSQAARYLAERVGNDQWQLCQEIHKLAAWDPLITVDTIDALVEPNLEASAFALLDAVMAGRAHDVQKIMGQMKLQQDPYEFFGLLVWQMHALAMVAVAPQLASAELAKKTGLKPFVVQKSQGLARRLGEGKTREAVEVIAQLDLQLKSAGVDPWLLIEQGMAKIGK